MIKAIYHSGQNGPVKVNISKVKTYKRTYTRRSKANKTKIPTDAWRVGDGGW